MKRIFGLLLGIQCSACAIGRGEQPPALFVNPITRDIIDCESEGRRAGNSAEANCILKGQQAAGYVSLRDLESSVSKPMPPPQPSPALDNQAKAKPSGMMSGVEKSRAEVMEKMTETRDGAERLLALRMEEVKKLTKNYRQHRELYDGGEISRRDLERSEHDLAAAVERVEEDRRWVVETEIALKEMSTRDELLRSAK
jgi:hypothetical protein